MTKKPSFASVVRALQQNRSSHHTSSSDAKAERETRDVDGRSSVSTGAAGRVSAGGSSCTSTVAGEETIDEGLGRRREVVDDRAVDAGKIGAQRREGGAGLRGISRDGSWDANAGGNAEAGNADAGDADARDADAGDADARYANGLLGRRRKDEEGDGRDGRSELHVCAEDC